jgi:hypothetical protein
MATDGDLSTIKGVYRVLADQAADEKQRAHFLACASVCDLPLFQQAYKPNAEGGGVGIHFYDMAYMTLIACHAKG